MIVTSIKLKYLEVTNYERGYSGADKYSVKLVFSDGKKEFSIVKNLAVDTNIEELIPGVLTEVRKTIKEANAPKGSGLLDGVVVQFDEDDENIDERLENAFRRVKEEARKLKMTKVAQNYLQNVLSFKGSRYTI